MTCRHGNYWRCFLTTSICWRSFHQTTTLSFSSIPQKSKCLLLTSYTPVFARKMNASCWLVTPQYFLEKSVLCVDLLLPSISQKSQCFVLTCYSPVFPRKLSARWLVTPQYFPEKSVPVDLLLPSISQKGKCLLTCYTPVIPRKVSACWLVTPQ